MGNFVNFLINEIIMMFSSGGFHINPPLQGIHLAYLDRISQIRHVKRDVSKLENLRDPLREMVGLPLGLEGAYYVGERIPSKHNSSVIDINKPPQGQPRRWCEWIPTEDGEFYFWAYERTYGYDSWLKYLIEHFFTPWNYKLSGRIECHYHCYRYVSLSGDGKNEVEIPCVEKHELVINGDNIIVKNILGTFRAEPE